MSETLYAALTRASASELDAEAQLIPQQFIPVFNAMPNIGLILNRYRQILFGNEPMIRRLGLRNLDEAFGRRPGELMRCVHAGTEESGCSAATECRYCGAVHVVIRSQLSGEPQSGECRIHSEISGQMMASDLRVTCTPFQHWDTTFYLVAIEDISALKQKQRLERTFFHDLTNSATGILYTSSLLENCRWPEKRTRYTASLNEQSRALVEEIQAQRDLLEAETATLETAFKLSNPCDLLEKELENFRLRYPKCTFSSHTSGSVYPLNSDSRLVRRVLVNLLKNAVEAEEGGEGEVSAGCHEQGGYLVFWVQNPAVMSEEVCSQIFQRNFSTKDVGRGIGTYSVKLLTQNYLGGKVDFVSGPETGTMFQVRLPLTLP